MIIFDIYGREIAILVDRMEDPGYKTVLFDASSLSDGRYYYRLKAGNYIETRKLLVLH